jgi:hypothetical protein
VEIWFQRQKPLGDPRWIYQTTSQPLTGVPDIVVSSANRVPLLVDAKFRFASESHSDEVYKMLGYSGNFSDRIEPGRLQGALTFIGGSDYVTVLESQQGGRLVLIAVEHHRRSSTPMEAAFDTALGAWLLTAS